MLGFILIYNLGFTSLGRATINGTVIDVTYFMIFDCCHFFVLLQYSSITTIQYNMYLPTN